MGPDSQRWAPIHRRRFCRWLHFTLVCELLSKFSVPVSSWRQSMFVSTPALLHSCSLDGHRRPVLVTPVERFSRKAPLCADTSRGQRQQRRDNSIGRVEETVVLAYHKRAGLVTTHSDELWRDTVYDDVLATLPKHLRQHRWHAIGRLDRDTVGLLLLTNDGALVHHATQPGTKVPKTYVAECRGSLSTGDVAQLRTGVQLTGGLGVTAPAEVDVLEERPAEGTTLLRIVISEGESPPPTSARGRAMTARPRRRKEPPGPPNASGSRLPGATPRACCGWGRAARRR